jgi:hypothetical protein
LTARQHKRQSTADAVAAVPDRLEWNLPGYEWTPCTIESRGAETLTVLWPEGHENRRTTVHASFLLDQMEQGKVRKV